MAKKRGMAKAAAKRTGTSKSYIRLLEGQINSKEYSDGVRKSVNRREGDGRSSMLVHA